MSILNILYGRIGAGPTHLTPDYYLYGDVGSDITSSNGVLSAWRSATQSNPTAQPLVTTDSVTSQRIVRFDIGKTLTIPSGTLDFASQGAVAFAIVARQHTYASSGDNHFFDTTNGGTTAGVQIRVRDNLTAPFGRQIVARVFDGTSWIVDYTDIGPSQAYIPLMWNVIVINVTSTSLSIYVDGYLWVYITFSAITFPAGATSPAVLGNWPADVMAFEVWQGGLSVSDIIVTTLRLQTRFSIPYKPVTLWTDTANGETDPSACTLSDNTYMAVSEHSASGSNSPLIQMRYSADGVTWTPSPGADGSSPGLVLPFTPAPGVGLLDPCITQLSNGSVIVVANDLTETTVRMLRATSAANARANTWTSETIITQGSPGLEICSSNPTEDPANPGTVYLCVYRGSAPGPWDGYVYKSTDYGATWAAPVKFANATADGLTGTGYAEPHVEVVPAAAAAKYSDLSTGELIFLIRDDSGITMWEFTAATSAGPFTRRATNIHGFSAARFRFLQDGTMVVLLRDYTTQWDCLFRRTGVVGGVAQYTVAPVSPAMNPSFGDVRGSGGNTGQYGAICKEVTPGLPLIVSANRLGILRCDTYARFFPEWQLYGAMPISISPSSVPTKNPGDTVQFSALGAGNFVWSMTANAPGCTIDSSTGLLTIGSAGGNVTVRCTDGNGYFDATKDVTIACNAASSGLPDTGNLVFRFDASTGVLPTSGPVNSVANQNGAASSATSNASNKPVYGTSTQNSLKTLDFTSGAILNTTLPGSSVVGFTDFTQLVAFKAGSSVAGLQTFSGTTFAGFVCRMSGGVLQVVDFSSGVIAHSFPDLVVTANTAHVVAFRRSGTTIDAWLDGVKSTNPGTVTNNAFPVGWPIGNDDASTLFGEQMLAYLCEQAMWGVAESDGNVTTAMTSLKTKWATT